MSPARLSAAGVSKEYGPRRVLSDLALVVEAGTVVAITGHNGSGKSTFLRCISGLASYRGTILVDGQDAAVMRRHIGYLPQSVGFPAWATAAEVLSFFAELRGVDPSSHPFDASFLPETDVPVGVLSGGQRQRVALAVSLLGLPDLVLLDEPAASLDDSGRQVLEEVVRDLSRAGAAVLVATPRADDLSAMFDRVVRLVDGRLENGKGPAVFPLEAVGP
jgi:ABC-type multidrug transport system ATPase subunit